MSTDSYTLIHTFLKISQIISPSHPKNIITDSSFVHSVNRASMLNLSTTMYTKKYNENLPPTNERRFILFLLSFTYIIEEKRWHFRHFTEYVPWSCSLCLSSWWDSVLSLRVESLEELLVIMRNNQVYLLTHEPWRLQLVPGQEPPRWFH